MAREPFTLEIAGTRVVGEVEIPYDRYKFDTMAGVNGPAIITELEGVGQIGDSSLNPGPNPIEVGPSTDWIVIPPGRTFRRHKKEGRAQGFHLK